MAQPPGPTRTGTLGSATTDTGTGQVVGGQGAGGDSGTGSVPPPSLPPFPGGGNSTLAVFVESMVGDACAPPDVRVLAGYIGRSSRGLKWWRLYLTLELDEWIDFDEDDVLYTADAGSQVLSGTVLWLRKDAPIWHQSVASQLMQAQDLLQGGLARRYLPHGVPSAVPPVQQRRVVQPNIPAGQSLQLGEAYDPVIDPPSVYRFC